MSGFIVLILLWNAALRVLVEQKSREVVKIQPRKLVSELRIAERTRLAADLHDSFSQNLTAIGYQVSTARNTGLRRGDTQDSRARRRRGIRRSALRRVSHLHKRFDCARSPERSPRARLERRTSWRGVENTYRR